MDGSRNLHTVYQVQYQSRHIQLFTLFVGDFSWRIAIFSSKTRYDLYSGRQDNLFSHLLFFMLLSLFQWPSNCKRPQVTYSFLNSTEVLGICSSVLLLNSILSHLQPIFIIFGIHR